MKSIAMFLGGAGLGAAAVNSTLVPHGENRGYFVGAGLMFVAAIILKLVAAFQARKGTRSFTQ